MKSLITRLRSIRGITLIEVLAACALLSIVMLATVSFVSYSAGNTAVTLQNASVQNEMRLMMLNIKNEVIAAIGGMIMDDAPASKLGDPGSKDTNVLFGFDGDRFRIAMREPGKIPETIHEYIYIPNLEVNFKMDPNIKNLLTVFISTDSDPDPRLRFNLREDILLPNLATSYGNPYENRIDPASAFGGGNSLFIVTPDPLW